MGRIPIIQNKRLRRHAGAALEAAAEGGGVRKAAGQRGFPHGIRAAQEHLFGGVDAHLHQVLLRRHALRGEEDAVKVRAVDADIPGEVADLNRVAVIALDVADRLVHVLVLARIGAAVRRFLQHGHRAVKAAHHLEQAAAAELLDHLTQIAREFLAVFDRDDVPVHKAGAPQDLEHVEAVERHPHVFPRVFAVRGVQRALPGADQKTGARGACEFFSVN